MYGCCSWYAHYYKFAKSMKLSNLVLSVGSAGTAEKQPLIPFSHVAFQNDFTKNWKKQGYSHVVLQLTILFWRHLLMHLNFCVTHFGPYSLKCQRILHGKKMQKEASKSDKKCKNSLAGEGTTTPLLSSAGKLTGGSEICGNWQIYSYFCKQNSSQQFISPSFVSAMFESCLISSTIVAAQAHETHRQLTSRSYVILYLSSPRRL